MYTHKSLLHKTAIAVLCALSFFALSIPFRYFFSLFTITEIRPAGALTPVFGLLFGAAGALGAALGNLAGDIFSGYTPSIYLPGLLLQFLYGYLPYKLWYLFNTDDEGFVHVKTVKNIIKYTVICLFCILLMSSFLGLLLQAHGFFADSFSAAAFAFFNNSIFCIILGVPLLIGAGYFNCRFFSPAVPPRKKALSVSLLLLALVPALAALIFYRLTRFESSLVSRVILAVTLAAALAGAAVSPADTRREYRGQRRKTLSLTEQAIIVFLFLGILAVIATGVTSFYDNYTYVEMTELWDSLFSSAGFSLIFLFALIFLILRFVERAVTKPVEQLSALMVLFAESSHTPQETERLLADCKQITCSNSEIASLVNTLSHTIIEVQDFTESLARVTAEKERMAAELEIAAQIQLSCLPPLASVSRPDSPGGLDAFMLPAKEVGGDFYDFFFVDGDRLALIIADVAGKGMPAALFMMYAKTLIKEYTQFGLPPGETFTRVNERLLDNESGLFVTAFMALVDTRSGEGLYVNAGHNPPFMKKNGGDFAPFTCKPTLMLGGLEDTEYEAGSFTMAANDRLFLYTDGVTEAMNGSGEQFGEERLQQALNSGQTEDGELIAAVKTALAAFVGSEAQSDDITMLAYTYKPTAT